MEHSLPHARRSAFGLITLAAPAFAAGRTNVGEGLFTSIGRPWRGHEGAATSYLCTRPIAAGRSLTGAAVQLPQTGRSCLAQRDRRVTVC